MKLIYTETIRKDWRSPFRAVKAYYPDAAVESGDLPAQICLEVGNYDSYREMEICGLRQWSMVTPEPSRTEAKVIRKAQEILAGGTFEELARKYCFELGWIEPRKL